MQRQTIDTEQCLQCLPMRVGIDVYVIEGENRRNPNDFFFSCRGILPPVGKNCPSSPLNAPSDAFIRIRLFNILTIRLIIIFHDTFPYTPVGYFFYNITCSFVTELCAFINNYEIKHNK